MAYTIIDPIIGAQPIADTSVTTQVHPLGTIVRAYDPTLGAGEFIYLKGVASTVVGSLVLYNQSAATTTLCPNTAVLDAPVAVAMSINVLANYGWYQIGGVATIKKTAVVVAVEVPLYISATAGSVMPTAASGKQIQNCRSANTASVLSATGTINAVINRPYARGAVT